MKNLVIVFIWSILILGCSNKKENVSKEVKTDSKVETKTELKKENRTVKTNEIVVESTVVSGFLKDINSLKQVKKPMKTFIAQAEKTADKSILFTKDNIQEVLDEAVNYNGFVIVVEDHTIVKIDDVKNCKASGSWGACMPFVKGFIKKGELKYQEDYCNFIIGTPNAQKRTAYFFK